MIFLLAHASLLGSFACLFNFPFSFSHANDDDDDDDEKERALAGDDLTFSSFPSLCPIHRPFPPPIIFFGGVWFPFPPPLPPQLSLWRAKSVSLDDCRFRRRKESFKERVDFDKASS